MFSISNLQPYFPVGIAVIGASLAYVYGTRSKKIERFYTNVETNLRDCCSPMFHEIRKIYKMESPNKRERMLIDFFEKYSLETTPLYKLAVRKIVDWYYWMEEDFYVFLKNRNEQNWDRFWRKFDAFYIMIEEEYWGNHYLIYREFTWLRSLWKGNSLFRFWREFAKGLYETTKFITIAVAVFLYFEFVDYFTMRKYTTSSLILITVYLLLISFVLFGITIMLSSGYQSSTRLQAGKGLFRKILEKMIPKIFKDGKFTEEKRLKNRDIKIPSMYKE